MVRVVWVLVPLILLSINIIVDLVVVIFCLQEREIIQKWLLVMVKVVLVLGQHTYSPIEVFLKEAEKMRGLVHIIMSAHHLT